MSIAVPISLLSDDANLAINYIKATLQKSGFPVDDLVVRKTEEYLTIEKMGEYPFCRLKLTGSLFYISLCIGSRRDIERLISSPIYTPLNNSNEKFTCFYISSPADIEKYGEGIVASYRFINRIPPDVDPAAFDVSGLSPEVSAFFALVEGFTVCNVKCEVTPDEIAFFSALLDKFAENGLNWRDFHPYRRSDGSITICGGVIRLQGRKTYMKYFPNSDSPPIQIEKKPLSEYIELQNYWVSHCLRNPDLIRF